MIKNFNSKHIYINSDKTFIVSVDDTPLVVSKRIRTLEDLYGIRIQPCDYLFVDKALIANNPQLISEMRIRNLGGTMKWIEN